MKKLKTLSLALSLLALLAASMLYAQESVSEDSTHIQALADQSFSAPEAWAEELIMQQGWGVQNPRLLADVNGDKRQDVVGFGNDGVWLALSNGSSFTPRFVLADLGYNQAWRVEKHVRLLGDIDGDKKADIVGFGDAGVYTALSTGTGFAGARFVIANFGYNQGWRVDKHLRILGDINGDGRDDIVAFGDDGVWLSLATGSGNFSEPTFVIQNFGANQGWNNSQHIRTLADVNGDGRQDIVAFGDQGVWVALSTGSGFESPRFVLPGFAPQAGGWRVDRHPRLLTDINNDGKADIVGFGDDGVWISLSNGTGFAPMKFVLANFGYNQGWRVNLHPRFVADLNGDGYKDIVGYGQSAVYRSLGGPTGFDPMRGVLRDLVASRSPFNLSNSAQLAPRFVADVNGDGMQDLVAFDLKQIKVARSSNQPPPPPPAAPSNLRITSASTTSISIAWNDNSNNESRFIITYGIAGGSTTSTSVSANVTTATIGTLASNTRYCFRVEAEGVFDISAATPIVCGTTGKATNLNTIYMVRQQIIEGPVPYVGSFGPISGGAVITNINFPTQYAPVLLVKPGHSTEECNNPDAVVQVYGDMTADQKKTIWGTSNITLTGQQKLNFVGCTTNPQLPDLLPVNIYWQNP